MVSVLVTTRFLAPAQRGSLVLALLTMTIALTALGNAGFAAIREARSSEAGYSNVVSAALVVTVVVGSLAAVALWLANDALGLYGRDGLTIIPLALPAMLVWQTAAAILLGDSRIQTANVLQFAAPLLVVVSLALTLSVKPNALGLAAEGWVSAQYAAAALGLVLTRGHYRRATVAGMYSVARRAFSATKLGIAIGAVNILALINYRIDLLILRSYRDLASVAVYSLAVSLAEIAFLPATALNLVTMTPVIREPEEVAVSLLARAARHAVILGAMMAGALAAIGWFVIPHAFGRAYGDSYTLMLLLLIGVVALAPAKILATYFSSRHAAAAIPLLAAGASIIVTAAVALVLVPAWGARGAAVASTAGYIALIVCELGFLVRRYRVSLRRFRPGRADVDDYRLFIARGAERV
jgi:O-antigen/teichoic acid export membrane protein